MAINPMSCSAIFVMPVCMVLACELPEEPSPEPREEVWIIDHDAWALTPPARDVYVERRPPGGVSCEAEVGYRAELFSGVDAFEIDTGWCNFLTVEQALMVDLRSDEQINLRMWHFELDAAEPAEAFLSVALAGVVVWEERVPIPGESDLIDAIIDVDVDYDEQTQIQFHLDNHGANSWALLEVVRQPDGE